jgi:hypothetical protein
MAKTLKSVAFLIAGGMLLATGGCTLTDVIKQILPILTGSSA